jgi:carbonic anhydrase
VLNVAQQLTHLAGYPCVRAAIAEGRLELAGMYFDIGEARMYLVGGEAQQDARRIRLRPVSESTGEMIASG